MKKRVLAALLTAALMMGILPGLSEMTVNAKEIVAGGYEIDMSDLPQVHFAQHPEWEELYQAAWEFHKENIRAISEKLNPELTNGDKISYYVDEAFDDRIFQWDTLFMMMFDKYGIHQFPTLNSMDNFYYHQWDTDDESDGYISRMIYEGSGADYYTNYMTVDAINPPLFGWAEWEQYQIHGDVTRFTQVIKGKPIIDRLASYFQFLKRTRRIKSGAMAGFYVSNGQGNGLDNTPNQDWGGWGQAANDITLQQVQAADYIAKIAGEIVAKSPDLSGADQEKYTQMEQTYIQERDSLKALVQEKMWSEEGNFFFNAYADSGEFTNIVTPTGLWALAAGVATSEQAEKMIETYALNSEKLFRPNGLSTVTYDYATFKPTGGYWNGSMWSPTSYQWIKGLQTYGYDDLAYQEAVRHIEALSDVYQAGYTDRDGNFLHTLWENYSSEYDIPGSTEFNDTQPSRVNFVGWTGALAIGSMIEDVLGVSVHAPDNEIHWNIHMVEEHGIQNLYLSTPEYGENRVTLLAAARDNSESPVTITVTAEQPVTLVVTAGGETQRLSVTAGTHTYTVGHGTAQGSKPTLNLATHDWDDAGVDAAMLESCLDVVSFGENEDASIVDGLKHQVRRSGLIYNVNTVGYRADSAANPAQLRDCAQMQSLGLENAQEYVKSAHTYGAEGFMFMAPADLELRTLYAVVGVQNGTAQLDAELSDASASRISETLTAGSTEQIYVVEIPYRAAGDGQNILVQFRLLEETVGASSSISLKGILLERGGREILPAPTQVTAEAGDRMVKLSADQAGGVEYDSYLIRYGTDPNNLDTQLTVSQLPVVIAGLENYVRYSFTVSGLKNGEESRRSALVQAVPQDQEMTDAQRAYLDYQRSLSTILNGNAGFDAVTGDLNFTLKGTVYGSTFQFYSDSDLSDVGVRNDGTVARPVGKDLTTSVLVEVTCGESTVRISLPVTVLGTEDSAVALVETSMPGMTSGLVDLTAEGSRDWVQFATAALDSCARKDTEAVIVVRTIGATEGNANDAPFTFTATDAAGQTPVDHRGIIVRGAEEGFEITLPYSEKTQVARIYSAVWGGTVTVTAEAGGKTYPVGTVARSTVSGMSGQCFEIKYLLPQESDTLTVRVICTTNLDEQWGGCSNVLQAVTLAETEEILTPPETPAEVEGLSVSLGRQPAEVDLTREGTRDWLLFDQAAVADMEQKQGGTILDDLTYLGSVERVDSGKGDTAFAYRDGSVAAAGSKRTNVVLNGEGNGISFLVPYGEGLQRIKVHFGAWSACATLTATVLRDGAPTARTISRSFDTGVQASGTSALYQAFTINCNLEPGESLAIRLETTEVHDKTWGNINIGAITVGETFYVKTAETTHGAIFTGVDSAYPGETVYVFTEAETGYQLKSGSLLAYTDGETPIPVTDGSFVMPQRDVTVKAEFALAHTHTLTHVPAKDATCTEEGNVEYWHCDCGKNFADNEGEDELTTVTTPIDPTNHVHTKLEGYKAATIFTTGYTGDLVCEDCGDIVKQGEVIPRIGSGIILPVNPGTPSYELPFVDVPEGEWYYESVYYAWDADLIDGTSATTFRPDNTLTVAEAIKLAAALHQLENDGVVTLKNGTANWYDTYVAYAVKEGIIEAKYQSYTQAQMNAPATRREFVHILHGALDEYEAMNAISDNAIPDVKTGDAYADEIYDFYRAGILTGSNAQGTFHPESSIKRSEVAAILIRMYDESMRLEKTL